MKANRRNSVRLVALVSLLFAQMATAGNGLLTYEQERRAVPPVPFTASETATMQERAGERSDLPFIRASGDDMPLILGLALVIAVVYAGYQIWYGTSPTD